MRRLASILCCQATADRDVHYQELFDDAKTRTNGASLVKRNERVVKLIKVTAVILFMAVHIIIFWQAYSNLPESTLDGNQKGSRKHLRLILILAVTYFVRGCELPWFASVSQAIQKDGIH